MHLTPIHPDFGMEVTDVDLRQVTSESGYRELRAAFDEHSLLLFRGQNLTDDEHLALAQLFGPLEDRESTDERVLAMVSNVMENGEVSAVDSFHTLNNIANQFWHTDSTFLPVPALANILQARVVASSGGETEFVSTRAGLRRLSPALRERVKHAVLWHKYAHSRSKVTTELATQEFIGKWEPQAWRAVWTNPVTGEDALYIASHTYAVDGMDAEEGAALIDELIEAMTTEEAILSHPWQEGDLIIWDERATLHRGRPWPYSEPRVLVSVCVSVSDRDGLAGVRPG